MTERHERLFFALWPDETARQCLSDAISEVRSITAHGKLVDFNNLHITLHFLGNIPVQRVRCYLRQAIKVRGRPFDLELTHLGHFKKPRVLWIGCDTIPPALEQLHADLGAMIETCGFNQESRPYRPHVSIARKINQSVAKQRITGIPWSVDQFVLIKSVIQNNAVQYRVKAAYPLRG